MKTFKKWVAFGCLILSTSSCRLKSDASVIVQNDFESIGPVVTEVFDLKSTPYFWKRLLRSTAFEYGVILSDKEAEVIFSEVERWSDEYQIDKSLIFSIIEKESHFYPLARNWNVRNSTGDYGLMQINSISIEDFNNRTGRSISEQDVLFDTALNIEVGCWVLNQKKECLIRNECYSIENLLYAYNAGQSRVLNDTVPQSTIKYGSDILLALNRYN